MKLKYCLNLLIIFLMSCSNDVDIAKPTISELISGKWDLTGIQNYDGGEIYKPTYPAVLEIIVRDLTADFADDEFGEYTSNGELHFINANLYGNAAFSNSYSKTWQWTWNEFEHSLTDMTATWDFPSSIYIIEASHDSLILQADGFPYWPKLFYKRHKDPITVKGFTYKASLNGHDYYLSNSTMKWTDAMQKTKFLPGHLVTISSQEENNLVVSILDSEPSVMNYGWIGITDKKNEGEFKWVTNEQVLYTNWGEGEPNNDQAFSNCMGEESCGEDYGVIHSSAHPHPGTWNDSPNNVYLYRAILEIDE